MIDLDIARQSAQLMRDRVRAWQNFLRILQAGGAIDKPDGCEHDLDLMRQCRSCGEHVPEADRA
jgi:hypothetical protein